MTSDPPSATTTTKSAFLPPMFVVLPTVSAVLSAISSGDLDRAITAGHRVVVVDAAASEADLDRPDVEIAQTDVWSDECGRRSAGATPKANAGTLAAADYLTSDDGLRRLVETGDRVVLVLDDDWWVSPSIPGNLTVTDPSGLAAVLAS